MAECAYKDEFGMECEFVGLTPEDGGYCWRHNPERPPILFVKNFQQYQAMDKLEGITKEEAAYYVDLGVARYLADDQVYDWYREAVLTGLKRIVMESVNGLRKLREANDVQTLKDSFATISSKKKALRTIKDSDDFTDEEKEYFAGIINKMRDCDFGMT